MAIYFDSTTDIVKDRRNRRSPVKERIFSATVRHIGIWRPVAADNSLRTALVKQYPVGPSTDR